MATKINCIEEFRKRIIKELEYPRINGSQEEGEPREPRIFSFPEDVDDEIAKNLVEDLNLEVSKFITGRFESFTNTLKSFHYNSKYRIESKLHGIHYLLYSSYLEKNVQSSINKIDSLYEEELHDILDNFERDIRHLFQSYRKSFSSLFSDMEDFVSKMRGYILVACLLERLRRFWRKDRFAYMRFNNVKIGGASIQSRFCEFVSKQIDFFKGNYSFFEILKLSEKFKPHICDDSFYYKYYKEKRKNELNSLIERICQTSEFRNRGNEISEFLNMFFGCLSEASSNELSLEEFKDICNQFIIERAIVEYELFRIAVWKGCPCLPKVCVYERRNGKNDEKISEIDLLILNDSSLFLIEITLRKNISDKEEKLSRVKELFEAQPDEISNFEVHILNSKDEFEGFIKNYL